MLRLLLALAFQVDAAPAARSAPPRSDFESALAKAGADYGPITKANAALLEDGRIEESNRSLLGKVPESERDAAHWFVLGNLLFGQDFDLSYRLHQKAHELAPKEPLVAFEWAIERHRKGELAEAEKLYDELDAGGVMTSNKQLAALRCECLLRLGRVSEAIDAWDFALKGEHGPVEDAFHWVHGQPNPWARRAPLLAKAKAGDADAATELWLLDLEWDTDWWNARPKAALVARDRPVVQKAVGADSPEGKALELLAKYTSADDDPLEAMKRKIASKEGKPEAKDDFAADAKSAGLLGEKPRLPKSSRLARRLLHLSVEHGAATEEGLHGWFGAELRCRLDAGDADALELACALAESGADDELDVLERIGWEKFSDAACVCGLLQRKGLPSMKRDDPLVVAALAKCGDHPKVAMIGLALAQRDKSGVIEAATRLALAQMRRLESVHPTMPVIRLIRKEMPPPAPK